MPGTPRAPAWTRSLAHLAGPFLAAGSCWLIAETLFWLTGGMG